MTFFSKFNLCHFISVTNIWVPPLLEKLRWHFPWRKVSISKKTWACHMRIISTVAAQRWTPFSDTPMIKGNFSQPTNRWSIRGYERTLKRIPRAFLLLAITDWTSGITKIYDQTYVAVASFRWTILSCLVYMLMNLDPGTLVDRNKMASV